MVESSPFSLEGKVALVTGGTRGIGRSIAEELGRAGAKVALCSRKQEACDEARSDLAGKGIDVLAQACNVSRKEELQALVGATRAKWGGIDIVVSNAAANPYFGPLTGISDEAFDKIVTNNVKSVLWLATLTLEDMAQRAKTTGKTASFIVLVRNLAAEWGPKSVRVNAIAPGLVKTDFARALWEDPKRAAERIAATPLRRLGEPRDIGGIAVFLASDAAAFITGQCIVADGGVTIL
jgi:dehydrogenase/reductase SDR family protein 4